MKILSRTLVGMLALAATVAAMPAAQPVALRPSPPLGHDLQAFPRLAATPGDPAAARINQTLTEAERGIGCDTPKGEWTRTVAVTMRGPDYVGFLANDDYYCGGPYPDSNQVALVFDLKTGRPIDWRQLFRPGVVETSGTGASGDSEQVSVVSATLWKLYSKAVLSDSGLKDCTSVFANSGLDTSLMLWPDAKANAVMAEANGFPHVIEACGPPISFAPAELRRLGLRPAFLEALATAHRNGWYGIGKR